MENEWLMFLHQIPPSPPYFRAKILRRLKQVGALAIKNSAYLLPNSDETLEDFQWLLREIKNGGGEAWLFRASAVAGLSAEELSAAFREMRSADYREMAEEAAKIESAAEWQRLKHRLEETIKIDYFAAPGRQELETLMQSIEKQSSPSSTTSPLAGLRGRTWVTRHGIKVDRISSAWLIRRFIDPQAKFSFVNPDTYKHHEGELRFDMFEGEFTHRGDSCTFEVLLADSGIDDPGLRAVAEIVHDLDLKEAKFNRPETPGVAAMIAGLARHESDDRRLEEGSPLFEALYRALLG